MSCTRPNFCTFVNGEFSKFCGRLSQRKIDYYKSLDGVELVPLACGRCPSCRLEHGKSWADRMLLEYDTERPAVYRDDGSLKFYASPKRNAFFLTLTYSDDKLLMVPCTDGQWRSSLHVPHVQGFMKRLRKAFPNYRLRCFYAGEYGDQTFRPHYHMILYGFPINLLDDCFVYSLKDNNPLYESPTLNGIWSFGSVRFCEANYGTFSYVSRYILKKQFVGDFDLDSYKGRVPPFCHMSNRPGLGADYFGSDWSEFPYKYVNSGDTVHKIGVPRYLLDKLSIDNPELYDKIKENRRFFASARDELLKESLNVDYFQYLRSCENSLQSKKQSAFVRNKI